MASDSAPCPLEAPHARMVCMHGADPTSAREQSPYGRARPTSVTAKCPPGTSRRPGTRGSRAAPVAATARCCRTSPRRTAPPARAPCGWSQAPRVPPSTTNFRTRADPSVIAKLRNRRARSVVATSVLSSSTNNRRPRRTSAGRCAASASTAVARSPRTTTPARRTRCCWREASASHGGIARSGARRSERARPPASPRAPARTVMRGTSETRSPKSAAADERDGEEDRRQNDRFA